jgi:hypothetical protein
MKDSIRITDDVELFTDGSTAKLQQGDLTIACSETETFGLLGSLRFACGLNADEFEVADTEDGPCIKLDKIGMKSLLDALESVRAAQDFDDDENWDF